MLLFAFYTFIALLLATLLGWFFLSLFFSRSFNSFIEKLGISFGLGLGLVTFIEFAFLYLRLKITPLGLAAVIIPILVILLSFIRKKKFPFLKTNREKFNLLSKILLFFIIVQGIWVVIKAFNLPIITDDAVGIWGFKAKVIYFSNLSGDTLKIIADKMKYTYQEKYPLLIPLAENYVNLFLGEWNDLYPKIIFPLYYFSLLLIFFGLLKRFTDKNHALIFTFFLSSLSFLTEQATWATADLAFTYYYIISFILILVWTQSRKNHYLYLSAIFSGFSIWTKNEGYPSFLINLTVIALFTIFNFRNNRKELFKGLAGFFSIILPIILIVIYYQSLVTATGKTTLVHQAFSFSNLIQNFPRLPYILDQFHRQLFGAPNKWNLLGYLFIFTFLINFKKAFGSFYFYMLLAIALNFALYITIFILASMDVNAYMNTSQNRVLMHFIPLMLFFTATILYRKRIG